MIGQVLAFVRKLVDGAHVSDVRMDPGGDDVLTAQHFAPPGDDSHPLPDDFMVTVPGSESGTEAVVGYADVRNAPEAGPGEVRRYARDPSSGVPVAVIWLRNNGDINITSLNGRNVTINGVVFDVGGNVSAPGELTAMSDGPVPIELSTHLHNSGTGPTTGPMPGGA
jgi:hypothetical protein